MLTPEQRTLRAQIAANSRWAAERDRTAAGLRGQAGLLARFAREVDPADELSLPERMCRAENARKAHMARMALRSSQARAARRGARNAS